MNKLLLLLAFVLAIPMASHAWTPKTQEEIALDALQLSPKYLRLILEKYRTSLLQGAQGPEKGLAINGTEQNIQETDLHKLIEDEGKLIGKRIKSAKHLPEVAYRFGVICHYVSHIGNPLNVANDDAAEAYYHALFEKYVEKELRNYRVAFKGYTNLPFQQVTMDDYLKGQATHIGRFYPSLSGEFMKNGKIADINTFSHQSIPFAVASLSYSYAVNTTADVWNGLWQSVGGSPKPQVHLAGQSSR